MRNPRLLGIPGMAIVLFVSGCATYETFKIEDFGTRTAHHETVAVLPFDMTIIVEELEEDEAEADIAAQGRDEAYAFQQQLYLELLERSGEFGVSFQDINTTNVTLERADIGYDAIYTHTKNELASLLGVDAVISGSISRSRPASAGAALATTVITGILSGGAVTVNPATNAVNVTSTLHDGADGALLWSFDDEASGSVGTSTTALTERLASGIASTVPYFQEDAE